MPTVQWSLNENDRLVIEGYTPESLPFDYEHPPATQWYMSYEQIIRAEAVPPPLSVSPPYPAGVWYMQDNLIVHASGMPDKLMQSKPYPASMWYYDSDLGHVFNSMIPLELIVHSDGAFTDCQNLHFVRIPKSVNQLGWRTFAGTALQKVCISRGCSYTPETFPPGCEVFYYEDIYSINYDTYIEGKNAFRMTDLLPFDENDTENEIP